MFKINLKTISLILSFVFISGHAYAYEVQQAKDSLLFNNFEGSYQLSLILPNGQKKTFTINNGEFKLFPNLMGMIKFDDGLYKFEMTPSHSSGNLANQIRQSNNPSLIQEYTQSNTENNKTFSGTFFMKKNAMVLPQQEKTTKDQQILDDLIVNGSACIGFDCVNGESFGFDTLRLKENNLRIKFEDTSSSASFPSNDWQITVNDSSNGGANKFSIDDIDGGRTPFTIEAGAKSNALYVDNAGSVGFGTNNPVVELHIVDGDSPTLRLEQNGSSGFTPQTWDVAGNETNFFIRDATNGSRLPFKIRPSAPTNSLYVNTNGNIGLGTASPIAKLHVKGGGRFEGAVVASGAGASFSVEDTNTVADNRTMLNLTNKGGSIIQFNNSTPFSTNWAIQTDSTDNTFKISSGGVNIATPVFQITTLGDIIQTGVTIHSSDRNKKKNIVNVNPKNILEKVSRLPIATWQYKKQGGKIIHMGPMAQDFRAAFGLGINDITISDTDVSGVALAAIKALKSELDLRDREMQKLKENNTQLEQRLFNLEAKFFAKEKSVVQQ